MGRDIAGDITGFPPGVFTGLQQVENPTTE
jgi:hypothetical protein